MTSGWREYAEFLINGLLPSDVIEEDNDRHEQLRREMTTTNNLRGVVMPFALEEVKTAIVAQKKNKAAGPDGINAEVLHHLVKMVSPYLRDLFNTCLLQGRIPRCLKEANMVILSKGEDKDPKLLKSYRPICLLNILGKIQERLLCKRLRDHRLLFGISNYQFGFRKGRSTEDAINCALWNVSNSNCKYVIGIFIDISGTFDNL